MNCQSGIIQSRVSTRYACPVEVVWLKPGLQRFEHKYRQECNATLGGQRWTSLFFM